MMANERGWTRDTAGVQRCREGKGKCVMLHGRPSEQSPGLSLGDGNEKPSVRVSVGYEARRMTRVEIEQQTNAGVVRAHGD